jgi:hypothetical protein
MIAHEGDFIFVYRNMLQFSRKQLFEWLFLIELSWQFRSHSSWLHQCATIRELKDNLTNQKSLSYFWRLPPAPPSAFCRQGIFWVCDGASVLQKLRKVIIFPKLRFLRPLRRAEARVASVRGNSDVRLVTSFEFVVFKVVCANAQANLYVPCPTRPIRAHKSATFLGDIVKTTRAWLPQRSIISL